MTDIRRELQRLADSDLIARERTAVQAERLRAHVRTRSDVEIIAHLWGVPVDRIPVDLLAMPKAEQVECLERLRREVSA